MKRNIISFDANLARKTTLNEAVLYGVLNNELHSWLPRKQITTYNNQTYVRLSLDDWQLKLPFMPAKTIQNTIRLLKQIGLIDLNTTLNTTPDDKTPWYTINYDKLEELEGENDG